MQAITSKPVTVVYDAISYADTQNAAYDVLAPGGTLVVVLNAAVDADKITPSKAIVHVMGSVQLPDNRAVGRELYANLTGLLETGEIKVRARGFWDDQLAQ